MNFSPITTRAAAIAAAILALFVLPSPSTAVAQPAKSAAPSSPAKSHPAAPPDSRGYKTIEWDSLVPKDWDPMKNLKSLNFSMLDDASPKAMDALKKMQDEWNQAPANPDLDQAKIRIPGYVVPLDGEKDALTEFLLVPYFGACIHVPPPPANQIIHVVATKPAKGFRTMDAVWVSGTVHVEHAESMMGSSGYKMSGNVIEPYKFPNGDKPK